MTPKSNDIIEEMNWESVVKQIFDMIGTNTAILDKYGIILASKIPEFKKGSLISPRLWDFILQRESVKAELGVDTIQSLVLETNSGNIVFTFAQTVYLLSQVPKNVELSHYMPSIARISATLDKSSKKQIKLDISPLDLENDFAQMDHKNDQQITEEKYPIFKNLIQHLSKK